MALQLINPEDLPTPSTYTHIVVATGTRMVFIAGQEPEDVHGNLVGPRHIVRPPGVMPMKPMTQQEEGAR